jgi:hypothetical protein
MERVLAYIWSMREDGWTEEHCAMMSFAEDDIVLHLCFGVFGVSILTYSTYDTRTLIIR